MIRLRLQLELTEPGQFTNRDLSVAFVDWLVEGNWALVEISAPRISGTGLLVEASRPDGDLAEAVVGLDRLLRRIPVGVVLRIEIESVPLRELRESAYGAFPTPRPGCSFCGWPSPSHARGCPYR
jgi:hypothetical protein